MQLTYVILSALSLLNVGVQGATIAKALTSREAHQVPTSLHVRAFHNADFGSAASQAKNLQATRHSDRAVGSEAIGMAEDITSPENLSKATTLNLNTEGLNDTNGNATTNPAFDELLESDYRPMLNAMNDAINTAGPTRRDGDSVSFKTPTKAATNPPIEPLRNGVSSSSDASSSAVSGYKNAVSSSPAVSGVSSSSVDPASPYQSLVSGPSVSTLGGILGMLSLPSTDMLSPSERRSNLGTDLAGKSTQISSGL